MVTVMLSASKCASERDIMAENAATDQQPRGERVEVDVAGDAQVATSKLAPFTPSGDGVLVFAMELLQLSADDVLFDLGCGDARILVHAAQTSGAK